MQQAQVFSFTYDIMFLAIFFLTNVTTWAQRRKGIAVIHICGLKLIVCYFSDICICCNLCELFHYGLIFIPIYFSCFYIHCSKHGSHQVSFHCFVLVLYDKSLMCVRDAFWFIWSFWIWRGYFDNGLETMLNLMC